MYDVGEMAAVTLAAAAYLGSANQSCGQVNKRCGYTTSLQIKSKTDKATSNAIDFCGVRASMA